MLVFQSIVRVCSRNLSWVGRVGLAFGFSCVSVSCSDTRPTTEGPVTPTPPVAVVLIIPTTSTLKVGQSQQFVASVPSGSATQFAWRAADTSVVSISTTGLASARKVGSTTISALIVSDTGLRGTVTLSVVP